MNRKNVGTHVRAFCREMMKSGWPPLNTILEEACTQTQLPLLVSSRKTLKSLSPVFITVREDKNCTPAILMHDS